MAITPLWDVSVLIVISPLAGSWAQFATLFAVESLPSIRAGLYISRPDQNRQCVSRAACNPPPRLPDKLLASIPLPLSHRNAKLSRMWTASPLELPASVSVALWSLVGPIAVWIW
jgi:hypothetical protein